MRRLLTLFALLLLSSALAATPASLAETVRSNLVDAQLGLMLSPASARAPLQKARAAYVKLDLAGLEPAIDVRAKTALARAEKAVQRGDEAAFAAAKAQLWTALLDAGFRRTTTAVQQDRPQDAASWLVLREFRQATRFSRPDADATLALRRWQAGELPKAQASEAVRADLLDTYGPGSKRLSQT